MKDPFFNQELHIQLSLAVKSDLAGEYQIELNDWTGWQEGTFEITGTDSFFPIFSGSTGTVTGTSYHDTINVIVTTQTTMAGRGGVMDVE